MTEAFFAYDVLPRQAETGVYQYPLVLLSFIVACFSSYTALELAQQLLHVKSVFERRLYHWGGAVAMGAGIWSMHFIGMLSYKMRMVISYDPWMTTLSMIIAVSVAYGVLEIVHRPKLSWQKILCGAVLLGFGIAGMHYTGMAAMDMQGEIRYNPAIFFVSIVIAITASFLALWMVFTIVRDQSRFRYLYQIAAALIMGAGICGMHYTGMAAAVFIPFANCLFDEHQDFAQQAVLIAIITCIILGLALAIGIYRRLNVEQKLSNSEKKLRIIVDSSLDAVISMDQSGKIIEWNRQAEATFGWTRDEALGQEMSEMIIPHEHRAGHHHGMKQFLMDGTQAILDRRIELTALNRGGDLFPVEVTVTAQMLEDDTYQFTAFLRDITEQKEAEARITRYMKELERSNQELDDFAYITSHDLKEPLRGLHTQSQFLIEDYGDTLNDDGKARLNRLSSLALKMEHLVNDLLYFSQLGRIEFAIQEVNPNEIVSEIEQLMESFLEERHAKIVILNPMPNIMCDKPRITEVFRNLITNAIKYNDKETPTVEVGYINQAAGPHGTERHVFYVRDNGIGIEAKFFDAIFRIFKRLNRPAEGQETGTGSGLTFVKKILERSGGTIWVQSQPKEGTTFYFTIGKGKTTNPLPSIE